MLLAKVSGTVVAAVRADGLDSPAYLVVSPMTPEGKPTGGDMIVLDIIGAGKDEIVMVSQGSSTRQTPSTVDKPVDALIVGIVDSVVENGREVYRK